MMEIALQILKLFLLFALHTANCVTYIFSDKLRILLKDCKILWKSYKINVNYQQDKMLLKFILLFTINLLRPDSRI